MILLPITVYSLRFMGLRYCQAYSSVPFTHYLTLSNIIFVIDNSHISPDLYIRMIIQYPDIPLWLHDSNFYRNLSADEPDGQIEIPAECYRMTSDNVHCCRDLANILKVVRYWGVSSIPNSVLEFCFVNDVSSWSEVVAEVAGVGSSEHIALTTAFKIHQWFPLEIALSTKRPEFITFWLLKNSSGYFPDSNAIPQACRFGRLDLIQTLREKGFAWEDSSYNAAAQYGHTKVLKYLHQHNLPVSCTALKFAARGGQLECMKFLHSIGCEWDEDVTAEFAVPAYYDDFKDPEHITDEISWTDDFSILPPADGYIECLRFALEKGAPITLKSSCQACKYGLLDCLQLLDQYNAPWNALTAGAAVSTGQLECLKYLRLHGCRMNETVTQAAAQGGQLECLKFLQNNNCPWDSMSTQGAAQYGHLHCLQYLHENQCPLDQIVSYHAAQLSKVDCLRHVLENGCPHTDTDLLVAAAASGSAACLQYLVEGRHLRHLQTGQIFEQAFLNAHPAIVEYLINVGCPFTTYDFKNPPYRAICLIHDANFLQCILLAVRHGWEYNQALYDFIMMRSGLLYPSLQLPLCLAYVEKERWERVLLEKGNIKKQRVV